MNETIIKVTYHYNNEIKIQPKALTLDLPSAGLTAEHVSMKLVGNGTKLSLFGLALKGCLVIVSLLQIQLLLLAC